MNDLLNPEKIIQMWDKDCDLDTANLTSELANNTKLYSKYLDLYLKYRVKKRQALSNFEKVDEYQTNYLKGRIAVDGKFYPYKMLDSEVKVIKKANTDFQKASENLEAFEIGVDVLSKILDQIKQRSFEIRAIKDITKMENGL